ncbi:MAG TPA: pitrilysin family protein [Thermoanaerobaculia bacterium]|nr:pitrilysin family protein [Thermoanaerobaculia bacterium]
MIARVRCLFVVAVAWLAAAFPSIAADDLVSHPSELEFAPLDFQVPRAESFRHELSNGIPVYLVEDHALPLVDIRIVVRMGQFLEPASKVGLAHLTGSLMRRGGTESLAPDELDERADFLAADISTSVGDTSGNASLNCLSSVLEECLDLFFDVLENPRFDARRLEIEKSNLLEELKQRNDHPAQIASREWQWLLYGDEHFTSRHVTGESLAVISRDDLVAFHRSWFRPQNMMIAVAGDTTADSLLPALEQRFASWSGGEGEEVPWPPPEARSVPEPGVYVVEKEIPQGNVRIGHLGKERQSWNDPDDAALSIMNDILGGGGFTSRLTKRIRSDEGLAYSAGSQFGVGTFWPGSFTVFYQSKSETVALAAKIAREEFERIRREPVSDEELRTAKASFIETFPSNFESARTVANLFTTDEYLGRPHDYWYDYRDRIAAVTEDDVKRVAEKYLHPDRLVMLIVGEWEQIEKGDADRRATMEGLIDGEATMLPLRDPVSLEPVATDPEG